MPIIKSAKKRVRVASKATARNTKTKRSLKTAVKNLHKAIKGGNKKTEAELKKAHSAVDTAAKKGVIHKNKAARKKSQLARAAKKAAGSSKPAAKKTVAKKPAAKKAPVKKAAPAKKPAAKKAPAKKPVAKKK